MKKVLDDRTRDCASNVMTTMLSHNMMLCAGERPSDEDINARSQADMAYLMRARQARSFNELRAVMIDVLVQCLTELRAAQVKLRGTGT